MSRLVKSHGDLDVYKIAFDASMKLFEISRSFPIEERYSLTDQLRRSSRSVTANLAEAWRRRRYQAAFINKLNECESEAAETQVWIQYAVECGYMTKDNARPIYKTYEKIIGSLVLMINQPDHWIITKTK